MNRAALTIACRSCTVGHAAGGACPFVSRPLRKGVVLFSEGDPGESLWFLRQGLVVADRQVPWSPAPVAWRLVRPGDLIGAETLAFPRHAHGAYTATPAVLCTLARDRAHAWFAGAALTVVRVLARQWMELAPCYRRSALARVAAWVAEALRFRALDALPRHVVAELLSITPETLSRALAQLEERGAIVVTRRHLEVKDLTALRAIADG